jgi:hypothetical protein
MLYFEEIHAACLPEKKVTRAVIESTVEEDASFLDLCETVETNQNFSKIKRENHSVFYFINFTSFYTLINFVGRVTLNFLI